MVRLFLIFIVKAILLDHRTKNSKHLEDDEKECSWKLLEKVYETEANKLQFSTTLAIPTQVDTDRVPSKKAKMIETLNDLLGCDTTSPPISSDKNEVSNYRYQPSCSAEQSPLQWWKDHKVDYPILAKLARRYLAIPATSAPCERVFSSSGNIITEKLSRLDPDTAQQLLFFIHENHHLCQ
jgi:hypothetical protein